MEITLLISIAKEFYGISELDMTQLEVKIARMLVNSHYLEVEMIGGERFYKPTHPAAYTG